MDSLQLIQEPHLKQTLNQHLIQQMKLLQYNSLELEEYLKQKVIDNPVLEIPLEDAVEVSWQDESSYLYRPSTYNKDDEKQLNPIENAKRQNLTLQDTLLEQAGCLKLSEIEYKIAEYIIYSLDEKGYWTESIDLTASSFSVPSEIVQSVLLKIQQLEPIGIAASSLSECLLLQLSEESGPEVELARKIIQNGLEQLAKNQISKLASKFHTTKKAILMAKEKICQLNPKPGANFMSQSPIPYISEDVIVKEDKGRLMVSVLDRWGKKFKLNQQYLHLVQATNQPQIRSYLKEQITKAKQLQQALHYRSKTLLLIFQALTLHQVNFFHLGPGHKVPLKLTDLAEYTGFNVSTISRALQHKYIYCQWGIYPANFFLTGMVTSKNLQKGQHINTMTEERLQNLIREIINNEDKHHPLSDQDICNELAKQNLKVARRTINKYRLKLGIKGKGERKVWLIP